MRISISNIAWETSEDETISALLRRHQVDAIDIAPGKYFPDPVHASEGEILRVREAWAGRGIQIVGMQALLFGTTGLNVFGPDEVQVALLTRLEGVCRIGGILGARRLVFGSPKNRDRGDLSREDAENAAIPFFRRLGDIAAAHDVLVCLEPNPPRYGANFMIDSTETAEVVSRVAHEHVRMQFDTGALVINGESPSEVLAKYAHLIGHVHLSEPDLVPLGDGATPHSEIARALKAALPRHTVTIEMVATREEPHAAAVERALGVAIMHYRDEFSEATS